MRDFRRGWSGTVCSFLSLAAPCFASGNALAQIPITQMMYVQPIDVCPDPGARGNCAPFNTLSPIGNPSNPDQTQNPIGFLDPATGQDITRVLLNQIGIDLTWLPIARLNNSSFQTLNVLQGTINCGLGGTVTGYQSCDLLTLTQQPCISKTPNPVCNIAAPLAPQPNVFNLFFVNKINPPASQPGTQIYDIVWVGNNGGALGGNTFFPPFPLTPRTDVPAHGLMHGLGTDHTILGAGPYNPFNAMTNPLGGIVPPFPAHPFIGECDAAYPACMKNLMTTGNLRIQPSPACMLAVPPLPGSCLAGGVPKPTFSNGRAAQLTLESMEDGSMPVPPDPPQLPISQQRYALLSGFLTPIADLPTTATAPVSAGLAISSATKSSMASLSSASSAQGDVPLITFDLPAPVDGLPGDTLAAWILIVSPGQALSSEPFQLVSQSRPGLLAGVDFPHPNLPYSPCAPAGVLCIAVEFNGSPGQGFGADATDHITFRLAILMGGSLITLDELCGTKVGYIFHSGSIITSTLGGSCSGSGAIVLTANSQSPDVTTPNQVVSPSTLITATDIPPCTPDSTGVCTDPTTTSPADAPPSDNAQVCHFHGQPVQCPGG